MNKYQKALYELEMVLKYKSYKYSDGRLIDLNLETINELITKYEKIEKALDKACEHLMKYDYYNNNKKFWMKEEWKEWCLQDEGN